MVVMVMMVVLEVAVAKMVVMVDLVLQDKVIMEEMLIPAKNLIKVEAVGVPQHQETHYMQEMVYLHL